MVAVSLQAEEPIWIGRKMDAVGAKFTAFLKPENVVPYPDNYVSSSEMHPMQFVAEEITRRKWHRGKIGVETDDYYYTAKWDALLKQGLPNARFVDAFLLINWCRMRKFPARNRIHAPSWQNRRCGAESSIREGSAGRAAMRCYGGTLSRDDSWLARVRRHVSV